MTLGEYLGGTAFALATLGACVAAATIVMRRRFGGLNGPPRVVAFGLLTTAALVAAHLVPLILGVLTRGTVVVAAAVGLGAVVLLVRPRADGPGHAPLRGVESPLSRAIAAAGVAALAGWVLWGAHVRGMTALNSTDLLTFNLPLLGDWIQQGSLWQVTEYFPRQSHGSYPHDGDLILLGALLPWRSDFPIAFVDFPYFALTGVAVYALGREIRAPRPAAALAAVVCVAMPAVTATAFLKAGPDTILLACFAGGALFLVRHVRTRARPDLLLAGLGLGLAFGTKWYGPTTVAVVIAVWAAGMLLAERRPRRVASDGALLVGAVLLAGGFWLVRNAIEYGSPIYPAPVRFLGITIFDAPRDVVRERIGFTIADYLGDWSVWRAAILPGLKASFGLGGLVLLFGAAGTVAATARGALRRARESDAAVPLALALAGLLVLAVYVLSPDTALGPKGEPVVGANARYAIPAAVLAAPALAWLAGRLGRYALLVELVLVAAVVDALRRPGLETETAGAIVLSALLLAAAVAAYRYRDGLASAGGRLSPAARAVAAACVVVAAVAVGYREQEQFDRHRYRNDPTFATIAAHARAGHKVGVAGTWTLGLEPPTWPMYGPRIHNRVRYVGRLHRGMVLPFRTRAAWTEDVRRHGLDLVLMGLAPSRERAWPAAAGFRAVVRSDRFVLYAVRP